MQEKKTNRDVQRNNLHFPPLNITKTQIVSRNLGSIPLETSLSIAKYRKFESFGYQFLQNVNNGPT